MTEFNPISALLTTETIQIFKLLPYPFCSRNMEPHGHARRTSISSAKSAEAPSYAQGFGGLSFSRSLTAKAVPARRSACLR
jgi:hypothetical protein